MLMYKRTVLTFRIRLNHGIVYRAYIAQRLITIECDFLVLTAPKMQGPFSKSLFTQNPTDRDKKKHHPPLQKKEMLPTVHQRTLDDGSYEYPAVLVLVHSDSFTILG